MYIILICDRAGEGLEIGGSEWEASGFAIESGRFLSELSISLNPFVQR